MGLVWTFEIDMPPHVTVKLEYPAEGMKAWEQVAARVGDQADRPKGGDSSKVSFIQCIHFHPPLRSTLPFTK